MSESKRMMATFQSLNRDLYWRVYDIEDGFIKWTGYDDNHWWNVVSPTKREKKGEKTGRTYRLDFNTNTVEVLP